MNKRILLLIILFFAAGTASAAEETVILLNVYNARQSKMSGETVVAGKDFLMVNGEKLSSAEIITQSQHIKKISEFKTSGTVQACSAGHFEHILKRGKLQKSESGCLESERYQELKSGFKALAKDDLTATK